MYAHKSKASKLRLAVPELWHSVAMKQQPGRNPALPQPELGTIGALGCRLGDLGPTIGQLAA